MKFLVKFDLEFDLKSEISDGKNLVKFGGRTVLPARKAQELSGRISGQISEQMTERVLETSFQILRLFSETSFSRSVPSVSKCSPIEFKITKVGVGFGIGNPTLSIF